jgi:hypothetical protein
MHTTTTRGSGHKAPALSAVGAKGPSQKKVSLREGANTKVQLHHDQPTTIAILGADTVVGRALCALLESNGYRTTPIASYTTGVVDKLLEGAHLLLLAPRLDEGVREAFLGAMGKSTPQKAQMPVIALSTTVEEKLPENERVISVPWPSETKVLIERIEEALLDAPASTIPTTQARRE